MNPKTTGILFLAAAALAAFVYFYEIRGESGRREAEEAEKRIFAVLDADDVDQIALTASDGVLVRAERREGRWRIVEPLEFPADSGAFDAMAAALAQTTSETAIEDSQEAAVYGLDAEEREVRFRAGETERALRIGDKTPVGSNSYVSVVGEDAVFIVPTHSVNAYAKSFDDLREKRILDFDPASVNRVEASFRDGRVVLERGDAGWALVEPIVGAADPEAVEGLLYDVAYLRAMGFVDSPPTDDAIGLDRPLFALRLTGSVPGEDGGSFEAALAIGSRPDGNTHLVRSAGKSLYRVASDRLETLPTEVVAYRFKQLAQFAPLAAKRIDILFHTASGESVALVAERGDASWASEPEAFQPGKLAALVGKLSNLRASDIAAESMGVEELRAVGLDPANAVFTIFGEGADVDAAEGSETAAPKLGEVHLGVLRGTGGIVAQRAGDDTVYVLDYQLAEHLPVSYEAFENRFRAEATEAEVEAPEAPAAP